MEISNKKIQGIEHIVMKTTEGVFYFIDSLGKRIMHREDGKPAIERVNKQNEYYEYGQKVPEEEAKMNARSRLEEYKQKNVAGF